jgi:hypothetical protein
VFSVMSALSANSILSALSRGSIRGWRSAGTASAVGEQRSHQHGNHRPGNHQHRGSSDWLPFSAR